MALIPALNSATTACPVLVTKGTGGRVELSVRLFEPGSVAGLDDNCEEIIADFELLCVDPEGIVTE